VSSDEAAVRAVRQFEIRLVPMADQTGLDGSRPAAIRCPTVFAPASLF
jgi:hypothetical protein